MNRLSATAAPAVLQRTLTFILLTVLFTPLNYMGSAVYELAGGLTTVKPYGGVALALVLILGERLLWPVLAAGTFGGIIAKLATASSLSDILLTLLVTSLTVLAVHLVTRQLIGRKPDFRAWRQLVGFIAIATLLSAASSSLFTLTMDMQRPRFWIDWQAWFIPTALSYVIFTPVMMLLATAECRVLLNNWLRISVCQLLMGAVLAINFVPIRLPMLFAIPMALLIVTLVSGLEGAALGLVLTEFVLTVAAAEGFGPSAIGYPSLGPQLYFIQIFIAILIAVMLPVAAAIAERIKLRDSMEQALEREAHVNMALRVSEQHARDMAEQAQAANNAKSQFLASMSHELRTPLNAILGFSEIIKSGLYGPLGHEKYAEYAEYVHKSGAHLLDLINDVLDLSKIDAGKMELRESTFSVREVVDDTVLLVRDKARANVEIRLLVDREMRNPGRQAADQADPAQHSLQRHQVHPQWRRHHGGRGRMHGRRVRDPCRRYRHWHGRSPAPESLFPLRPDRFQDRPHPSGHGSWPAHRALAGQTPWRRPGGQEHAGRRHAHDAHPARKPDRPRLAPGGLLRRLDRDATSNRTHLRSQTSF